jgi:hypothetical protein
MIVCISNCTPAKCLLAPNKCETPQNLVIGEMPAANTDYWVYVYDESRDKIKRIEATSDANSILTIDLSDHAAFYHPYAYYYFWVTEEAADITAKEDIIIDSETYTCFKLEFSMAFNDTNEQVFITTQNITI